MVSTCDGVCPAGLCHVCLHAGALGGGIGATSQAGLGGGGLKLGSGLGGGLGPSSGLGGGEWVYVQCVWDIGWGACGCVCGRGCMYVRTYVIVCACLGCMWL